MLAIVGAGAMGAALAGHCARSDPSSTLFATEFDQHVVAAMATGQEHPALGVTLPSTVGCVPYEEWSDRLGEVERVIVAVSSAGLSNTIKDLVPHISTDAHWALATKGWDEASNLTPAAVLGAELGSDDRIAVLGGPVLAPELIVGAPSAMVCAASNPAVIEIFATVLRTDNMRLATTDDVVGVQLCAAYKNVVAIAVGLCEGLADAISDSPDAHGFIDARAAVFALGLRDMHRLVETSGGRARTVVGLAGSGDLYVTSLGGRNGRYGRLLGSGYSAADATETLKTTVEGVTNAHSAVRVAVELGIELPVATAVCDIVTEKVSPLEALRTVLAWVETS